MNTARRCLVWSLLPWLCGCYASNVVARADRAILVAPAELPWQPATAVALDGLFESISIEGEAAVALQRIWYFFARDGRYAGAALVDTPDGPQFQTLNGRWQLGEQGLVLDDAAPATTEAAPEHLRLRNDGGTLVLKKVRRQ